MKVVIGLVGRIGSGKTVVANYLNEKYNAESKRFSQILMDILDRLYMPNNRNNLQKLGALLRREFGEDVIVNAFERDLKSINAKTIAIDGIRYRNEVKMLRKFKRNILIFIDAPSKLRYERVRKRGEKGESEITYGEFMKAEECETERYIGKIKTEAEYIIDNSGTLNDLFKSVDKIMKNENILPIHNHNP